MAKGKAKTAKNKGSKASKKKKQKPILKWREDAPHLTVVGALVGAVLFTLILGANLAKPKDERDTSVEMALSRPIDREPALDPASGSDSLPVTQAARASDEANTDAVSEDSELRDPPAEPAPRPQREASQSATTPSQPKRITTPPPTDSTPVGRGGLRNRTLTDSSRLADASGWSLQFMVTCKADTAKRVLSDAGQDSRLYLLPVSLEGRDCYRVCWDTFSSRDTAAASRDYPAALAALADPIPRPVAELR